MNSRRPIKANPAGNITLFIFDTVAPTKRSLMAETLMKGTDVEQVAYVCPPLGEADGRIEMMGGEFCGNATRAYGLLLALDKKIQGKGELSVECSGSAVPLKVTVNTENNTASAQMPLPLAVENCEVQGIKGTLVRLPGITHFVVTGVEPDETILDQVESDLKGISPSDAYGVCFLDPENMSMTPLVDVLDTHSRTWEGSCGSGSIACACAQCLDEQDGVFIKKYTQPAGIIQATVEKEHGKIRDVSIGGTVTFE